MWPNHAWEIECHFAGITWTTILPAWSGYSYGHGTFDCQVQKIRQCPLMWRAGWCWSLVSAPACYTAHDSCNHVPRPQLNVGTGSAQTMHVFDAPESYLQRLIHFDTKSCLLHSHVWLWIWGHTKLVTDLSKPERSQLYSDRIRLVAFPAEIEAIIRSGQPKCKPSTLPMLMLYMQAILRSWTKGIQVRPLRLWSCLLCWKLWSAERKRISWVTWVQVEGDSLEH